MNSENAGLENKTSEPETQEKKSGLWGYIKTALPWIFTALIFYYIFKKVPLKEVLEALASVKPAWWIPILVADFSGYFLVETICHYYAFNWMAAKTGFVEVMLPKGATFILNILNFALGVGGMGYWLARKKGVEIKIAASAIFFLVLMDILNVFLVSAVGIGFMPDVGIVDFFRAGPEGRLVRTVLIALVIFAVLIIIWVKKPKRPGWLGILFRGPFAGFDRLKFEHFVKITLVKGAAFALDVVATKLGLMAFGIDVSIVKITAYLPLIYLIGALPITVMRLGTTQAAWLYFFHDIIPDPTILAFSLLWTLTTKVLRALTGVICLPWTLDDFRKQD